MVELNPGVHVFLFESDGYRPAEQEAVIKTADKNRAIEVVLPPLVSTTSAATGPTEPGEAERASDGPVPTAAYVTGAVGLLGWTGFTFFALKHKGQIDDLDACSPACPQTEIDDASKTRSFAFVSLGVGVVATGITTFLILDRPQEEPSGEPSLGFVPFSDGAAAILTGTF